MNGDFWNTDNPDKVWGPLDVDEILLIPLDFSAWLENQGTTYVSHTLTAQSGLAVEDVSVAAGVISFRVGKDPAKTLVTGAMYGVTCLMLSADGQKKSKTLYFKIQVL